MTESTIQVFGYEALISFGDRTHIVAIVGDPEGASAVVTRVTVPGKRTGWTATTTPNSTAYLPGFDMGPVSDLELGKKILSIFVTFATPTEFEAIANKHEVPKSFQGRINGALKQGKTRVESIINNGIPSAGPRVLVYDPITGALVSP